MLTTKYRDLLAMWDERGIHDDPPTRDVALTVVLPALWGEYGQLEAALAETTAALGEVDDDAAG